MRRLLGVSLLAATIAGCGGGGDQILAPQASNSAGTLYVDCSFTRDAGGSQSDVGSERNPINTLADLNSRKLAPGSRVRFKHGTTCNGMFKPAAGSSGTAEAPIVVDAYGDVAKGRPVIAAGCTQTDLDPDQSKTEAAKSATGISPYASLCKQDAAATNAAALHLYNVQYWEINDLELTNDALSEGARLGLLVQLEDFGTGKHYRVNNVYVHHVRGQLKNLGSGASTQPGKKTGGIQFAVTRDNETATVKEQKTNFQDVVVENNEIYNVDLVGLSTWSDWMCRDISPSCMNNKPYMNKQLAWTTAAYNDWSPSTGIVFRNNKIHNIAGDAMIVRASQSAQVEGNLAYDVWMRAPGNSAGMWVINSDDALFTFNEVHSVHLQGIEPGDGMAYDADLGTRNARFVANYSHDNEGGMMLFCGCGTNEGGNQAKAIGAVVAGNLSVNDGRRILSAAGSDAATLTGNTVVISAALNTPLVENLNLASNEIGFVDNKFYALSGNGQYFRTKNAQGSYDKLIWSGNKFFGFADTGAINTGATPNQFLPVSGVNPDAIVAAWFGTSGFQGEKYQAAHIN